MNDFDDINMTHIRGVHGQAAGHAFYEYVRLFGVQNKTLISNTVYLVYVIALQPECLAEV